MTMPSTAEAGVIAAEGVPIVLLLPGPTEVRLRYSMASLRALEDRYGSLVRMSTALEGFAPKPGEDAQPGDAAIFGPIIDMITPGLLHVRTTDPDTGQPVRLGKRPDLVGEALDPGRLTEYLEALGAAIKEAFGVLGEGLPDPTVPGPGTIGSPGPAGITPPQSLSVVPNGGSGG